MGSWLREWIMFPRRLLFLVALACILAGILAGRASAQTQITLSNGYTFPENVTGLEIYCSLVQPLERHSGPGVDGRDAYWFTANGDPLEGAEAELMFPKGTCFPGYHSGAWVIEPYSSEAVTRTGYSADASDIAQRWMSISTYTGPSYTITPYSPGAAGSADAALFFFATGTGSTFPPVAPALFSSSWGASAVELEQGAGYVQLILPAHRVYKKTASSGANYVAVEGSTHAATNPSGDIVFAEFRVRPITRGGGGGGSDPYTQALADAFGAEEYAGGLLGEAIIATRDYSELTNVLLNAMYGTLVESLDIQSQLLAQLTTLRTELTTRYTTAMGKLDTANAHLSTITGTLSELIDVMESVGLDTSQLADILDAINTNAGTLIERLDTIITQVTAFRSETSTALSLMYERLGLIQTDVSAITLATASILSKFNELLDYLTEQDDPSLSALTASDVYIDADKFDTITGRPAAHEHGFEVPTWEATAPHESWSHTLNLAGLNSIADVGWSSMTIGVNFTFLAGLRPWIRLPIIFGAMIWAMALVWEELRRT